MDEARLRRAAEALATVTVFNRHQIGEIERISLRYLLEDLRHVGDPVLIDEVLLEMARAVVRAYNETDADASDVPKM